MRARDGSRLRAESSQQADRAGSRQAAAGSRGRSEQGVRRPAALHVVSAAATRSTPRRSIAPPVASDVEVLKLMIARGAQIEWSPTEVKKERGRRRRRPRRTPTSERLRSWSPWPAAAARRSRQVPGSTASDRRRSARPSNRDPLEALKVLLAAGANPNAKAPDGSTPLHQAVTARQVAIIRALVGGRREAGRDQQRQSDAAAAGRKAAGPTPASQ